MGCLLVTIVAIILLLEIVLLLLLLVLFFDQLGQDRSRCCTNSPSSSHSDLDVRQILFHRRCFIVCRTLLWNNFTSCNIVRCRKEIIFGIFLSGGTDGHGRILTVFIFHRRRIRSITRCTFFGCCRVIGCHGNAWVLFLWFLLVKNKIKGLNAAIYVDEGGVRRKFFYGKMLNE